MAAPVWQTVATLAGADATSAVVTLPTGIVAGDIVLIALYKENTAAITPPAGYTQKAQTATTAVQQHTLFWHRASGSESGTVTFSWTGSAWRAATADRISGCASSGDPWDSAPATALSNTAVSTSPAVSLAATSTDTLLYFSATNFNGGNAYTPPTGFTERADIDVISSNTKANAPGGSTGSVTSAMGVSGASTAILGALMADTGGGGPTAVQAAQVWPGF